MTKKALKDQNSNLKSLSKSIKNKDLFGHQASLPILKKEGRQSKNTFFGGIISIITVVLYVSYSINNIAKLFNR